MKKDICFFEIHNRDKFQIMENIFFFIELKRSRCTQD